MRFICFLITLYTYSPLLETLTEGHLEATHEPLHGHGHAVEQHHDARELRRVLRDVQPRRSIGHAAVTRNQAPAMSPAMGATPDHLLQLLRHRLARTMGRGRQLVG